MIPTTTPREALEALRSAAQIAQAQLLAAQTAEQRQVAQFWVDYFDRQMKRWERHVH